MYANARVPDRKYLWTVVSLFTLLGLLGLGVLLYRPLKLRYAIYRTKHADYSWRLPDLATPWADKWAELCLSEACKGNRAAADAVIDACGAMQPDLERAETNSFHTWTTCVSITYPLAAEQPDMFFELLGSRLDSKVLKVLAEIVQGVYGDWNLYKIADLGHPRPSEIVVALEPALRIENTKARRVATAALNFTRRQFARELAEAERKP